MPAGRDELIARVERKRDALALRAAELLLDVLDSDDGLAHAAADVVAERRARGDAR